jgi:DNA-directed RNA polymerase specialized sigma24 family protein
MQSDPFIFWEQTSEIEAFKTSSLSDFEARVFEMRYDGMKYSEIAAALGCAPKAVDNAVQRIKKKYLCFKSRQ